MNLANYMILNVKDRDFLTQ